MAVGKKVLHNQADTKFEIVSAYSVEPGVKLHDRSVKVKSTPIGAPVASCDVFMGLMEFVFMDSVREPARSELAPPRGGILQGPSSPPQAPTWQMEAPT